MRRKKRRDLRKFDKFYSEKATTLHLKSLVDLIKLIRYKEFLDDSFKTYTTLESELVEKVLKLVTEIYQSDSNTKTSCIIGEKLLSLIRENYTDSEISDILSNRKEQLYKSVKLGNDDVVVYFPDTDTSLDRESVDLSQRAIDKVRTEEKLLLGQVEVEEDNIYFILDTMQDQNVPLEDARQSYIKTVKEISKFVAPLRRKLVLQNKDYEDSLKGCRFGLLDTTKLTEAYQGVPQVYMRKQKVSTSKLSICILVDESGSMENWGGSSFKSRSDIAREAAILFREAFGNVPGVDLFIYGYSADEPGFEENNTVLRVYNEPGDAPTKYYGLTNIRARRENRDGNSILNAAKRIRKKTSEHLIMFVISDGFPCANDYYGTPAFKDTRKKIEQVQNKYDTDVIGICIASDLEGADKLYDTVISLDKELDKLPEKLGSIISSTIIKNRRVSYTS